MYLPDLLIQLKNNGIELKVDGNRLYLQPQSAMTPEMLKTMRQYKQQVLVYLIKQQGGSFSLYNNPPECHNPLTPHATHKLPHECDPNSCYCYATFGYPRYCQGVPCRWIWPSLVEEEEKEKS